jgi:hypothetical protein
MEEKKLKTSSDYTISLDVAKDLTNNYREAVMPLFGGIEKLVPKGFFIPFEDIKELANRYPNASGVRAYFTLPQPSFIAGEGISGILVPVEIMPDGLYKDIILTNTAKGEVGDENDTSIYDFTKPCPDCCDPSSELY